MSDFKLVSVLNPTVVLTAGPAFSAGTQSQATGTISFANSNGITFGLNNGTVTASIVPGAAAGIAALGAGTNTATSGTVIFGSSAGNVTFGMGTDGYVTASAPTGGGGGGSDGINALVINGGASTASTTLTLSNSNNITFGLNAGVITASASFPAQTIQPVAISGSNASFAFSTLSLGSSNGMHFYTTNGSIVGSYTVPTQTVQTQNMVSVQGSTGNITFANANNITFGFNASTVTASASFPAQTVDTNKAGTGFTTTTVAGSVIAGTQNTDGLKLAVPAYLTTAQPPGAYLTTARASNDAIGLNTAQSNVTWTVNSSGLSLDARGYAGTGTTFNGANISGSITLNSNGINLSLSGGAGGGGGTTNQTGPNIAAGTQTATSGTVVFSNSNGISFGMSDSSVVTASVNLIDIGVSNLGATAGTTGTLEGGRYVFAGTNGITLSQSQNGSQQTLSIVAAPITLSSFCPWWPGQAVQTLSVGALGTSTASAYVFPYQIVDYLNFNCIKIEFTASVVTSTISGNQTITSMFGLFSNNAGTLSLISSGSFSIANTISSVSGTFSFPSATGTTGYAYGTSSASTVAQMQSLFGTGGTRVADLQFGNSMSLSPGVYWLGIHQRQSTSSAAVGLNTVVLGIPQNAITAVGPLGQSTANFTSRSDYHFGAFGVYTSTGSAGYGGTQLPSSMLLSGFNNNISVLPLISFMST